MRNAEKTGNSKKRREGIGKRKNSIGTGIDKGR
jgi:hypothetical protein